MIGSKGMVGEVLEDASYYARLDGMPIQTCLDRIGGDWLQIATARPCRTFRCQLSTVTSPAMPEPNI